MKKLYIIAFYLVVTQYISAQAGERLSPLKFNPQVYYKTREAQALQRGNPYKYLVAQGNFVVTTATLSLPFVDDFSQNRLPNVNWLPGNIIDSFYNVIGGCITKEGLSTTTSAFLRKDTAWYYTPRNVYLADTIYTYDSTFIYNYTITVSDSTPQPQMYFSVFNLYDSTGCLTSNGPDSMVPYWNAYYHYDFDTFGNVIDSIFMHPEDTILITYANEVYFAKGEPNTLWFDDYAYVNNTYPIDPPTIGVATLDGLNQYGLPYNNSTDAVYGQADFLTSLPIDLSGYTPADSFIYLSFFYEAGGLGIVPHVMDSLILEFKDDVGIWHTVWADTGFADPSLAPDTFQQVLVKVDTASNGHKYHIANFQFRFRNMANLSGNDDHWHIDYVKLDKNRSAADTIINDIAFVYPFPTILKNYTQLPGNLFRGPTDLADSIVLTINNLGSNAINNPPATPYITVANELYPTLANVLTTPVSSFNAAPVNNIIVQPSVQYNITDSLPVDSIVIISQSSISPNDNLPLNDTLRQIQNMNFVMAYDDGSAEAAYGLTGLGLNKVAYEFDLAHPDTLVGFQVMFTQVNDNVSDLVFSFAGWDSLQLNDFNFIDTPIVELDNMLPLYIDSVNGFATYVLDTPVIISGKFYMGWIQDDTRSLQIGYDLNSTLGIQHLLYYTNAEWHNSAVTPGSLMIRLILDSHYGGSGSPTGVKDLTKGTDNPMVFPNPTSGVLNITNTKVNTSYEVTVVDMVGREVQYDALVHNYFSINKLPNGIYLLSMRDVSSGKTFHSKIVKASN